MLAVLTERMGELAFPLMATKITADTHAVLEFSLIRKGFRNWGAFFDMKDAHGEGFIRSFPLLSHLIISAVGLALATFGSCSRLLSS